jgi:hypothetical protein
MLDEGVLEELEPERLDPHTEYPLCRNSSP